MTTLKETAQEYEVPTTKNIADLERVPVDVAITTETHEKKEPKEGEDKEFTVNVITVDDIKYRVPNSVLEQLKIQLSKIPDLKYFAVSKTGEGFNTKYTVVPLRD